MRDSQREIHKMMKPALLTYLPLLLLFLLSSLAKGDPDTPTHVNHSVGAVEMVPMVEPGRLSSAMLFNETRRRLGSFQICALCTCCGGPKGLCLPSPCCYAINCNIPNRPFGFCSFTPKSCNCFGCI
ncbi:hypothetical protein QJS10_CPB04g01251 [Acorus calamus]|uniref:DUF7866 domain-containing protein n=1 Tax=Acorus calamus TaxID=4465 RepID=A0AAV9F2G1_ACOCL|nr:hypothetical protein QJS10_CPB04g01242 [Acorus calamus]KAK1319832.1 hypothetical protein QJS10_CPB04g01251 [Acorus calamus]